ncbi:MAG: glucosamine kinase [Mycobacterium sp.]|nr:glucosamine kinase [Mycobacterium sp.]
MQPDTSTAPVDLLALDDGHALAIVERDGSLSALPVVRTPGGWQRATAGDGTADALVRLLAQAPGHSSHGRFSVVSWTGRYLRGLERPITVDQTNESVIVGEQAVVKWATHLQPGPHPAPGRLATLTAAGFTAMPSPWGVVTWTPEHGDETLVATVNGYLPGAVDGWTWAKELFIAAAASGDLAEVAATSRALGAVVADLHAALGMTSSRSTSQDAKRWRDSAFDTLGEARLLAGPANALLLTEHAENIEQILNGLSELVDVPVLDAHGDLHVGQVLRADELLVITDFDGNPVLPPAERVLPVPAAVDLAGILQSLAHVAIVAVKRSELGADALAETDRVSRAELYGAYIDRLTQCGHADLHLGTAVGAFRLQQVLREIVYAGRHLPRWMYVPDAALPALLTEMSR